MAHLFVTGSSGLVGRETVRHLEAAGHRVTGLSRSSGSGRPTDVVGNVLEARRFIDRMRDVDAVVHLAAVTGKAPKADYSSINVDGTRELLGAARDAGVSRFLFCSSIAAGFPDRRQYPYAESKVEGERLVRQSGLRFTTIRPTIVTGPGAPVVARLAALAGLPLVPLFGGGQVRVQPIAAVDLARFIVDLVDTDRFAGETLDFGGPDVLSMRDLLARLRPSGSGRPATFLPIPIDALVSVVGLAERVAYPLLPVTVGQLATFRFDGIARPNDLWERRRATMQTVEQMAATGPAHER